MFLIFKTLKIKRGKKLKPICIEHKRESPEA